ncbi:hypothetical protein HK100_002653 [Physocladia obscura]|uniref:Protein-lysine N-methyltransferase EFM6 n=1 Tax=Physocladia obscura TaxID=109957 RepID=A0AAD5XA34_9FUNG|nr:hypothetical protein HK100_002653 [Physocladia obscura]
MADDTTSENDMFAIVPGILQTFVPLTADIISEDSSGGCGGKTWEAATVLSNYLVYRYTRNKSFLGGMNVVELGAGTGVVGILVAMMMAETLNPEKKESSVYITDMLFLDLMQKNVDLNLLESERKYAKVRELKWGTPCPPEILEEPVNLILASDCVYLETAFDSLLETLIELSTVDVTELLIVSKKRRKADKRFFDKLKKKFAVVEVTVFCLMFSAPYMYNRLKKTQIIKRIPVKTYGRVDFKAETPFVAVGCASKENNLFIIENTAPQTINFFDSMLEGTGLKITSAFSVPDKIYKCSFSGNKLVTGGRNSRLQIFKIDLAEIGNRGKGLEHLIECKLNSGNLADVSVAPPGTRVASVRIHDVEFSPSPSSDVPAQKFSALLGRKVFIWDLEASKTVSSEMVSHDQLMCASWSTHEPYGSLLAVGGVDHHISLLDARLLGADNGKSVVWKVERAHGGHHHPAITSIKFNFFVPYWLASAGEDSVVKLWDLRYLKNPVAKIEGNYQGIQSICWSNTHAEILTTGANDCSFKVWCVDGSVVVPFNSSRSLFVGSPATEWSDTPNLSKLKLTDPSFCTGAKLLADVVEFSGPVISVNVSWSQQNAFFALSTLGELSAIVLRPELFKSTAPHRFKQQDAPIEHSIETLVYQRDLASALFQVVQLSKKSLMEHRTFGEHDKEMIDLCTPKDVIYPITWAVANRGGISVAGSIRKIAGQWKEEGKEGGKEMVERIRMYQTVIPAKNRTEFESAVLKFNTLVDAGKKNWENILKAEDIVCKGIKQDPTFFESDYLKLLVECVLPNDYTRGLSFGFKIAQVVDLSLSPATQYKFLELAGMIGLLLFPTVFESETWIIDPSNLERKWIDGRGPKMRQIWIRGFLDDFVQEKIRSKSAGDRKAVKKRGKVEHEEIEGRKHISIENLLHDPVAVLDMIRTEINVLKEISKSLPNEETAEAIIKIVTGEDEVTLCFLQEDLKSILHFVSIFRHAESAAIAKLKFYTESAYGAAMNQINEIEKNKMQPVANMAHDLTAAAKPMREILCTVIKIGLILAQLMEAKNVLEKDGIELSARCISVLRELLNLTSEFVLKLLDTMERDFGKIGFAGVYARDLAALAQEEIRHLCRGCSKPSEAKTRATATIIATSTGASLKDSSSGGAFMEDVYTYIEKLARITKQNQA